MNMIYGVKDKPKFSQTLIFAIQQLLAIMAATLVVPVITNAATGSTLSPAAALFGAGIGTLVYLLFTKFRSPVFLRSSCRLWSLGLQLPSSAFLWPETPFPTSCPAA